MAKFIFISPYLKGGKDAAKLTHRTRYFATREGVALLQSDNADLLPSDKQEAFIARALKQFPEVRELRGYAAQEVKETCGQISFDNALDIQRQL